MVKRGSLIDAPTATLTGMATPESPLGNEEHAEVVQRRARIAEWLLGAAGAAGGVAAVSLSALEAAAFPAAAPVALVAGSSLGRIAVAAFERRQEERLMLSKRARAWADEAWDMVMASRGI